MKRQWRIGRMLGAALLLGCAALLWALWPQSPRWRIPAEEMLGFDENRKVLYTISSGTKDAYDLRGYDLITGVKRILLPIVPISRDNSSYWIWLLSPDKTLLAACSRMNGNIQVFDVSSGKLLYDFESPSRVNTIGFSQDSRLLATRCWKLITVRDLATGKVTQQLEMTRDAAGREQNDPNTIEGCDTNCIQIDPYRRYLVVQGDGCSIIYDFKTHQELAHCENKYTPRFLKDGETLLFSSGGSFSRARMENGKLEEQPFQLQPNIQPMYPFQISNNHLLTLEEDYGPSPAWLDWMPEQVRNWLGWRGVIVNIWSLQTGNVAQSLSLPVAKERKGNFGITIGGRSVFPGEAEISNDGNLLAINDETDLSIWEIPPRRSLWSWLTSGTLLLGVILLAWPRKVKAS